MANKKFEISASLDTSEFDKAVESMQKKLKDIYAPADQVRSQQLTNQRLGAAGFGQMSSATQQQYSAATMQGRREMDALISKEVKEQEKYVKLLTQRTDLVKKLREEQSKMVEGSSEELKIKERISQIEANNQRLREQNAARNKTINMALDQRDKLVPRDLAGIMEAFRGGGFKHGMSTIPEAFRLNPMMMGGSLLSGIGAALSGGAAMYRDFSAMPIRTEAAMGSAVQGIPGRDVNTVYARRSAFENMYAPERAKAARQALDKLEADKLSDKLGLVGNAAMVGGGAATAIGTGWTGIGALAGIGVAGKGIWNMLSDERQRSLMLSPISKTASNRYQSILAEDLSKNYQTALEGQKNQNPYKTAAIGEYEQNFQRNLSMQRMMGLKNEDFYGKTYFEGPTGKTKDAGGGFMRDAISKGFTPEMAMEMASSIQGSGGSTRMMRDASYGLELQRQFGLTNSGQVLGTLSSGLGSSEASKSATVRILAEGMKQGLDASQFAEENRKFTQAAAEIISRSSAQSDSDLTRLASQFGSFMNQNTTRGIEGAKSAFEEYQQVSSETTGPRGTMRAAGFMKNETLSKLSTMSKQALMSVPDNELTENNPQVIAAALEAGVEPKDIIKEVHGITKNAMSRFKSTDEARDRLKAKGFDTSKMSDMNYIKSLPEDMQKDFQRVVSSMNVEFGYGGIEKSRARISGYLGGKEGEPATEESNKGFIQKIMDRFKGDTGRMEDTTIKSMAADAGTVLKNFQEMSTEMKSAAENASKFTDQVREMNAALMKALEDANKSGDKSGVLNTIKEYLNKQTTGGNQSQAGKTSK